MKNDGIDLLSLPCVKNRETRVFHPKAIGRRSRRCRITEIAIANRENCASGYAALEKKGRSCKLCYKQSDIEINQGEVNAL